MCPIDFITAAVAADAFHEQRAENHPVIYRELAGEDEAWDCTNAITRRRRHNASKSSNK